MKKINPSKFPLLLVVYRPSPSDEDYESQTTHGGHNDQASAEERLATLKPGWVEATLCVRHGAELVPKYRRYPQSEWRQVRHWPTCKKNKKPPPLTDDARRIAQWLERAGVTAKWDGLMREPWPGRERGEFTGGSMVGQCRDLRVENRRRERSPIEAIVALIMQDGIERGAFMVHSQERDERHDDLMDKTLKFLLARTEKLEAELESLRKSHHPVRKMGGSR